MLRDMLRDTLRLTTLLAAGGASFLGAPTGSAAPPEGFTRESVPGDWEEIVGIVPVGDGRFVAWERAGLVWMLGPDLAMSMEPMIDLQEEVGAWRDHGLLGLALDPAFLDNGRIYLMYVVDRHHLLNFGTPKYDPDVDEYFAATIGRITRYEATEASERSTIDPSTRRTLLGGSITDGIPILHQSHGVGTILFGSDGTLIASTGDSASYNGVDTGGQVSGGSINQALQDGIITPDQDLGAFRAQYLDTLCGKILRLDPDTGLGVASNPWFDPESPRSPRSRIWSLGLRNPFRLSLRSGTGSDEPADGDPGSLTYGDVGWLTFEEIGLIDAPGLNNGWPLFEGLEANTPYWTTNTMHPTASNPLSGDGCPVGFRFRDLLMHDTEDDRPPANPCEPNWRLPVSWKGPTLENEFGGYTGDGYLDYGFSIGETIDFLVDCPANGVQSFQVRFANGGDEPRPIAVDIDGTALTTLDIPPTGAWSKWRTASFSTDLVAGTHQITLRTFEPTGPNIDRLDAPGLPSAPILSVPASSHNRPWFDIRHGTGGTRIATFAGGDPTETAIEDATSPISGVPFNANSITIGPAQLHPAWPAEWRGLFFADYIRRWLRVLRFDADGRPLSIEMFDQTAGEIAALTADPASGDLIAIRWSDRPIRYTPPVNPCPADLSGDGIMNGGDIGLLLAAWGTPDVDLDGDGTTGGADLGLILAAWGPCPG
ncbi:MAG: PQQ-dependent sugar dehydrogenase [Phycisphaerales bacterium]|nr:PQQ-dependent sugar dehydrogenase [Phycisphaerales bacterium]